MRQSYTNEDVLRLQNSLAAIRVLNGWSLEAFGKMIGVSKSTISNLESNRVAMSNTRYETIIAFLNKQIKKSKDDCLSTIVTILTDKNLSDKKRENVKAFVYGAKKANLPIDVILSGVKSLVKNEG